MFWYVISMTGDFRDEEDVRIIDDRGLAYVAMRICGLRVRVVAK